jgi:uncharacterized iron-regulated protein
MRLAILAAVLVLGTWGCAGFSHLFAPLDEVRIPGVARALKPWDVLETEGATLLSFPQMLEKLTLASVVFVGETHTRFQDHEVQLRVVRYLHASTGTLWIGLEMLQRRHQDALDAFIGGVLDEEGLQKAVEWPKVWGYDFALYAPIFRFAREHRIRLLALNARSELVRKVARKGLSGLTPEETEEIPSPWPSASEEYRARIQNQYEGHDQGRLPSLEQFVEAQLLWDVTMAETLAREMVDWQDPGPLRVAVLVGRGHLGRGMGVPKALEDRLPLPYAMVVPVDPEQGPEVELSWGDYLVAVPPD